MKEIQDEVLDSLSCTLIRPLGGRENHHWLVQKDSEQVVLRRWSQQPVASIAFERWLLNELERLGWPVAPLTEPTEIDGSLYSFSQFLTGEPKAKSHDWNPRGRGRQMAEFHQSTSTLSPICDRPGWRRCEHVLADLSIDHTLNQFELRLPEEIRVARWHLDKARQLTEAVELGNRESIPIHGDFAPWNLLYSGDKLTGMLDFELSRTDHRVAEFALAWRGKYDEVIAGYEEVSPFNKEERAAIVPVWWALLIEQIVKQLRLDGTLDDWSITKLLTRSPMTEGIL